MFGGLHGVAGLAKQGEFPAALEDGHSQRQLRVGVAGLDFAHVAVTAAQRQLQRRPHFGPLKLHSAARHHQALAGLAGYRCALQAAVAGGFQRAGLAPFQAAQALGVEVVADGAGKPRQFVLRAPVGGVGLDALGARLVQVAQHFMHLGLVGLAQRQLLAHRIFLFRHQALELDAPVENPAGVDLLGVGCGHIALHRLAHVVGVEAGGGDAGAGLAFARADAAEGIDGLADLEAGGARVALVDADAAGLVAVVAVAAPAGNVDGGKAQRAGFGELLAGFLHAAAGGADARVALQRVAERLVERVGRVGGCRELLGVGEGCEGGEEEGRGERGEGGTAGERAARPDRPR